MTTKHILQQLIFALFSLATAVPAIAADPQNLGYKDTPLIPGTQWHVHDGDRPQPRIVTPGASFSHQASAPSDAVVLFDGKDLSKWEISGGHEAKWKVENGYMEVAAKSGSIRTKDKFADFQLHLEFATPSEVKGNGQGRGNSGVLFNGIYEVPIPMARPARFTVIRRRWSTRANPRGTGRAMTSSLSRRAGTRAANS